jgi:hypothetical protein
MLGNTDEYFVHQTIDTIDHVATSDPRFTDRLVFYAHDNPGDCLLMFGLGAFPNMNVMDGYCLAYRDGTQYNLRFSRELHADREVMRCGPLTLTIVEPFKEWRLVMDDNPYGVAFDLTFRARCPVFEHNPIFRRVDALTVWHQLHYQQSGSYTGSARIGGVDVRMDGWWGSRDRSWGVRGEVPGTRSSVEGASGVAGTAATAWMTAQFDDFTLQNWCSKDMANNQIVHIDGGISHSDGTQAPFRFTDWSFEKLETDASGRVSKLRNFLTDNERNVHEVDIERVLTMYISGIVFDDGRFYGFWRGPEVVEGSHWNLNDPAELERVRSIRGRAAESLVIYRYNGSVGSGIYESALLG